MSIPPSPSHSASTAASATRNQPTVTWLSPKRRRTTGNLKSGRPGQAATNSISEKWQEEASVAVNHDQAVGRPHLSPRAASHFAGISSHHQRRGSGEVAKSGRKEMIGSGGRKERGDSVIDGGGIGLEVKDQKSVEDSLDERPADRGDDSSVLGRILARHTAYMKHMVQVQAESEQRVRAMMEGMASRRSSALEFLDLSHLWTYLDRIQGTVEKLGEARRGVKGEGEDVVEVEVTPVASTEDLLHVAERLDGLQAAVEENSAVLRKWSEDHSAEHQWIEPALVETRLAIENNPNGPDITELEERVASVQTAVERIALELASLRESNVETTKQLQSVLEIQRRQASPPRSVNIRPLTDQLASIHTTVLERAQCKLRKPDLDDFASRLHELQSLADRNAKAIEHLAVQQTIAHTSLYQTSSQIRSLADVTQKASSDRDVRLDAVACQLREVLAGQAEMRASMKDIVVEGVRDAESARCGHVVVPPPRKVGRKIVGFVYER